MKGIKITYPKLVNEIGFKIGMHRAESNRISDIHKPFNVRPDDYNVRGAIGELIFMIYLERNGYEYQFNKFFADEPVSDYDVVIIKNNKEYYIDVKCLSEKTEILNVTYDSHNNNNKRVNGYAFVKLHGNNEATIYKFTKEEISNWEVMHKNRENGQTKFFGKIIENSEQYFAETFVSKGTDEHKYYEQSRGINVNSFQSEAPKKEEYIVKVTDVTSSQTEISDEEIEKAAEDWQEYRQGAGKQSFEQGAKWYREQLKQRQ